MNGIPALKKPKDDDYEVEANLGYIDAVSQKNLKSSMFWIISSWEKKARQDCTWLPWFVLKSFGNNDCVRQSWLAEGCV